MAPVTRSVYRQLMLERLAFIRKERALGRAVRRTFGGVRSSPRLAALRWRRMVTYNWENPRDCARFKRRVVGYTWDRIMGASSDNQFYRRIVRLMERYPGMVDASVDLRRVLAGVRDMNNAEGNSQARVGRVYRQLGRTSYYGF